MDNRPARASDLDERDDDHTLYESGPDPETGPTQAEENRMRQDILDHIEAAGADERIVDMKRQALQVEAKDAAE